MGKTVMSLYVSGHFSLYVGRRLNADGSVVAVGRVNNVYNTSDKFHVTGGSFSNGLFDSHLFALRNRQILDSGMFYGDTNILPGVPLFDYVADSRPELALPVFFNYAGSGQGTMIFDSSQENISYNENAGNTYDGVTVNPNYLQQADLRYRNFGDVIYGNNIEVFDYGPIETGFSTGVGKTGPTVILNNPLNAPVHYISNSNSNYNWEEVAIGLALAPVEVQGKDTFTRVEIDPQYSQSVTAYYSPGGLPGWGTGIGAVNLLDTIQANVTVSHAGLSIRANVAGSAAPSTLPQIVLADNQITGMGGAPIQFANLTNGYSKNSPNVSPPDQFPGLYLRMPTYGAVSTLIQNTPIGATTELDTSSVAIGAVNVLGTTGPLSLANLNNGDSSFGYAGGLFYFAASSVTIGNGTLQNIAGPIAFGRGYHAPTTIDDRADSSPRQVTFSDVPNVYNYNTTDYVISGLAPAAFYASTSILSPQFDIYGPAASQYTARRALQNARLFAGAGSTVEVTNSSSFPYLPAMTILGAQSVLIDPQQSISFNSDYQISVIADPARPTALSDLVVDYSHVFPGDMRIDSIGNGRDALFVNSIGQPIQNISYQSATTRLTLHADNFFPTITKSPSSIRVSAALSVDSGNDSLNVQGTNGPLQILQSVGKTTLGNNGSLLGIHSTGRRSGQQSQPSPADKSDWTIPPIPQRGPLTSSPMPRAIPRSRCS